MTTLPEFQTPTISAEEVDDNQGSFTIEPLDKGFGYTYGNSLRRVLLSSLKGAAITSVRIEGVAHEFSSIAGVKEDVTDIILNLKDIVVRMHTDADVVEVPLVATGPGEMTAGDIETPAGVEILNPEAPIATLEKKTKLEMYLTVGRGRGYSPAEDNKTEDQPIGVIPIDSIFSPIKRAVLPGRLLASRSAHRLRQALAAARDRRLDRARLGAAGGGGADDRQPGDLHRRRSRSRSSPRPTAPSRRPPRRRAPDRGRRPADRGARDRRPRLQLPEAGRACRRSATCRAKSESELKAIPNFGERSIEEVIEAMHGLGLDLRDE